MNATQVLLFVISGLTLIEMSSQYVSSPTCFGQVCPASTSSCKEHKKSSYDRSRIEIKITCLDDFDSSLKDYYFEEPSQLDRYTAYENTRYESINEGLSNVPKSYGAVDLTPSHQGLEYY